MFIQAVWGKKGECKYPHSSSNCAQICMEAHNTLYFPTALSSLDLQAQKVLTDCYAVHFHLTNLREIP